MLSKFCPLCGVIEQWNHHCQVSSLPSSGCPVVHQGTLGCVNMGKQTRPGAQSWARASPISLPLPFSTGRWHLSAVPSEILNKSITAWSTWSPVLLSHHHSIPFVSLPLQLLSPNSFSMTLSPSGLGLFINSKHNPHGAGLPWLWIMGRMRRTVD